MSLVVKELDSMYWNRKQEINLNENITTSVKAFIGSDTEEGANGFTITVCNIDYVKKQIFVKGYFSGLWHVVLNNPSYDNILGFFNSHISKYTEDTWEECLNNLRKIAMWEFEDYTQ